MYRAARVRRPITSGEISGDQISPKRVKYTTSLAVDIAEPGVLPPVPNVIQRVVFTDAVPHVHVAVWDPTDLLAGLEQAGGVV